MIKIINHAKKEEQDLFLRCHMDLMKIGYVLMHCQTFPLGDVKSIKIRGSVIPAPNEMGTFIIEKNEPLLVRQTFSELFIMAGISVFERYCKEWFAWGLKYSPTRLNSYSNESVKFYEILKSKDVKQALINIIIKDIKFQDIEECNKEFKKVFGFKIFNNIKDTHKFKKYLNHRHIISHNCGYIDIKYLQKEGKSDKLIGNSIAIKDEQLEEFFQLILDIMYAIHENITAIIYKELEKDIKPEKKVTG